MSGVDARFVVSSFRPAYLAPAVADTLAQRSRAAVDSLGACHSCPRNCGVNRLAGEEGFCRTGRHARVCSVFAHFGEESCLVGARGSGTIFFGGCNLGCVFCQNHDISQGDAGMPRPAKDIAALMIALQERGCHNVNLVTPEHVVPQMIEAVAIAIEGGLGVPIVYNTSAYDAVESIRAMEGLVDVYMPDFKLWSRACCERYLGARDYAERARAAIGEMHRQVGDLCLTPDGVACRGLLVRHLVMPGLMEESAAILRWLAGLSAGTFVNIMGQYHPENRVGRPGDDGGERSIAFAEINRRPASREIDQVYQVARQAGLWRFDKA